MAHCRNGGSTYRGATEDGSVKALSPNSLRPISYLGVIWELYVLDLKTKVFFGEKEFIFSNMQVKGI